MLLPSCKGRKVEEFNPETLITMYGENMTMSESKNGNLDYVMRTPLMERYELARDPYSKYPQGLYVESYQDSTELVQSTLKGDFAIYYEKQDLWMVTGNVVATSENGRTLYTEQLFYNVKMNRIYSNVESTLVEGENITIGEGFESDDKFEVFEFKNIVGRGLVEDLGIGVGGGMAGDATAGDEAVEGEVGNEGVVGDDVAGEVVSEGTTEVEAVGAEIAGEEAPGNNNDSENSRGDESAAEGVES